MPLDRLCNFYTDFDASKVAGLSEIYDDKIEFVDPIHRVVGLKNLQQYFLQVGAGCQSQFEITHRLVQDNQAFLRWHMHYSHPKLAAGKALVLVGGSYLNFDKKITRHEDFYDMGKMIYQHLPALGWAVKYINHRLIGKK